jgi:hypothetical protein
MASTLGKRKRRTAKDLEGQEKDDIRINQADAQERLRRYFESKFDPLPETRKPAGAESALEDESEEFLGFESDSEPEEDEVQIVEHTDAQSTTVVMSKEERKAFMVSD